MPQWDRSQWHAAEQIVQALLDRHAAPSFPSFPYQQIQGLHRLRQRWEQAAARGWRVAAATLQDTWDVHLRWLITDLQACRVGPTSPIPLVPTTAQVYRDLMALHDEFDFVDIDPKAHTISVRTDRIVLDDFDLGPFALVWKWSQDFDNLRVIAQDPRPADYPENLTHPHVRDDELCVGEAQAALDQAFQTGRLFDAFLILRQVLKTYNPESAYASLARWTGRACHGCAESVSEDHSWSCATCGEEFCDACAHCCDGCGNTVCDSCQLICPECENRFCNACRALVEGRRIQLCQTCHETRASEEEIADEVDEPPLPLDEGHSPSEVDLHPDRLGETALSAGRG